MPARTDSADRPSPAAATRRGLWTGLDQANAMGVELIAAILTWSAIGWLADRWLGTTPWLFIAGALLGNAAGLYLVWIRSARMRAADAPQPAGESAAGEATSHEAAPAPLGGERVS